MNILFDIGHPAHVHLFKNFITYLKNNNYYIKVVSRKKDVLLSLLNYYNIKNISLSRPGKYLLGMSIEAFVRDLKIFGLQRKYKFDFAFGTSVSIGHLSFISKKVKSYNFNEDDDRIVPLYAYISYPFSTNIINPTCLKYTRWKNKRILHNSYHELAYLHPNNFTPDTSILQKYNLEPHKFIIIRHSALDAHHDKGAKGLRGKVWNNIEKLIQDYPKVVSKENEKSHQIDPWDMHHILAFAKLVISDSQTMTAEAAVLGVPSMRYNSFVGKISYLEELEHKYNLTYGFLPDRDEDKLIMKLKEMLQADNLKDIWKKKKEYMLTEKIDLNQWMIDLFEKEIGKKI